MRKHETIPFTTGSSHGLSRMLYARLEPLLIGQGTKESFVGLESGHTMWKALHKSVAMLYSATFSTIYTSFEYGSKPTDPPGNLGKIFVRKGTEQSRPTKEGIVRNSGQLLPLLWVMDRMADIQCFQRRQIDMLNLTHRNCCLGVALEFLGRGS